MEAQRGPKGRDGFRLGSRQRGPAARDGAKASHGPKHSNLKILNCIERNISTTISVEKIRSARFNEHS